MSLIAIAGIALIVLLILAFNQYTEGLGKTAVLACAGVFGGYGVANVVTKKLTQESVVDMVGARSKGAAAKVKASK